MFSEKYRPREFDDVVGSTNVISSLTKLVEKDKLPNTLILHGDNGIGKTSIAYILAKMLLIAKDKSKKAEIEKELYNSTTKNPLSDIYEFDLGKDRDDKYVDSVLEVFRYPSKYRKVIILDEIQNLSQMNMTKFLKTFEKVDPNAFVIICTTELYKLHNGIISRCEVFELQPPTPFELTAHLTAICESEIILYEHSALYTISRMKYRVRDAINTLETVFNTYGDVTQKSVQEYFGKSDQELCARFLESTKESSPYAMLEVLSSVKESLGIYKFTQSLKEYFIDSIYIRYGITPLFYSDKSKELINNLINKFSSEELLEILHSLDNLSNKSNVDKELGLLRLGFMLSNGSILKYVNVNAEKTYNKQLKDKEFLSEGAIIDSVVGAYTGGKKNEFNLLKDSPIIDLENRENVKTKYEIEDETSLFLGFGGVDSSEE